MTTEHRADPGAHGPRLAVILFHGLAFLLLYTAWVWAGLRPSFHGVGLLTAALLLGLLVLGSSAWRRDPVFWLGLLLLGYLSVQAANSGRACYYDVGWQRWVFGPPRWPAAPWCFERTEALDLLGWFFSAWVAALVVRSPLFGRRAAHRLLTLLAAGSGLLALFGIAQFALAARAIYGVTPLHGTFFASFAYANHAAAYFCLTAALSAGLLFRELLETGQAARPRRVAMLAGSLLLCLAAANLSLSRAGILLGGLLALLIVAFAFVRGWKTQPPAGRVKLVAASLGACGLLFFAVAGFGEHAIRREFMPVPVAQSVSVPLLRQVNLAWGDRPLLLRAAWSMWKDHRWFGVGGWGFRHLVGHYVPAAQWKSLRYEGKANVHCDALQFLVEFGLVGAGLLAAPILVLVLGGLRSLRDGGAPVFFGWIGLALVGVFGLLDLPFRCPAILYVGSAVLAALPKLVLPALAANAIPR